MKYREMADEEELSPFDVDQIKQQLEKYELLDCIGTGKCCETILESNSVAKFPTLL